MRLILGNNAPPNYDAQVSWTLSYGFGWGNIVNPNTDPNGDPDSNPHWTKTYLKSYPTYTGIGDVTGVALPVSFSNWVAGPVYYKGCGLSFARSTHMVRALGASPWNDALTGARGNVNFTTLAGEPGGVRFQKSRVTYSWSDTFIYGESIYNVGDRWWGIKGEVLEDTPTPELSLGLLGVVATGTNAGDYGEMLGLTQGVSGTVDENGIIGNADLGALTEAMAEYGERCITLGFICLPANDIVRGDVNTVIDEAAMKQIMSLTVPTDTRSYEFVEEPVYAWLATGEVEYLYYQWTSIGIDQWGGHLDPALVTLPQYMRVNVNPIPARIAHP